MKHLILFSGIITSLFSFYSCDLSEKKERCERDYNFLIPVTSSPMQDTFQVGDTIHIDMNFSARMKDINTDDFIDLSEFPFILEIQMAWIDKNPAVSAEKDFQFIPRIGDLDIRPITSGVAVLIKPIVIEDKFSAVFDIVLDTTGLTGFSFINREPLGGFTDIEPDCKTKSVSISFSTNNQENNNYHLLASSPDPRVNETEKSFFDQLGSYIFVVVE